MSEWLKAPIKWTGEYKSLLLEKTTEQIPEISLDDFIQKSANFPIKFSVQFSVDSGRCYKLVKNAFLEILENNINSAYPIMHEYGLHLCSVFLKNKQNFGQNQDFYKKLSLLDFIDRLVKKRAIVFFARQHMDAPDKFLWVAFWKIIGSEYEVSPLILDNYISYDEMKLSALLSFSSHSIFINYGEKENLGVLVDSSENIERMGVIIGVCGPILEKPLLMEYQEIIISREQNTEKNGYGIENSVQSVFMEFYGAPNKTYQQREEELKNHDSRYFNLGKDKFLDKVMYEKRISLSIDTLLFDANHRAKKEYRNAYIHIVDPSLDLPKIYNNLNQMFITTFTQRLEHLSEILTNITDVHFADFDVESAGVYQNGDKVKGKIKIHITKDSIPHRVLRGDHEGKLLVVCYPLNPNALPGNEFWESDPKFSLSDSYNCAAACSSQIAELHNGLINDKIAGMNLRVVTYKGEVVTFEEYQKAHRDD